MSDRWFGHPRKYKTNWTGRYFIHRPSGNGGHLCEKRRGIASETATGSAMIHAVAHLGINGRWAPTAKVHIRYDWTKPPGIDLLGQRVEFVKLADDRLRPIIADLERSLPNELFKLNLKSQLATAWAQEFTSIPLCLIPRFDGAILSLEWKEAVWDRYVTGAPRPRTPSEQQYSDRKLRSRR